MYIGQLKAIFERDSMAFNKITQALILWCFNEEGEGLPFLRTLEYEPIDSPDDIISYCSDLMIKEDNATFSISNPQDTRWTVLTEYLRKIKTHDVLSAFMYHCVSVDVYVPFFDDYGNIRSELTRDMTSLNDKAWLEVTLPGDILSEYFCGTQEIELTPLHR